MYARTMLDRYPTALLLVALTAVMCGAQPNTSPADDTTTAATAWDTCVEQFLNDYFAANPDFAVEAGRHEFDGQLPDWSAEGLRKEIARLRGQREKAAAFQDDELDDRRRFERDYLISRIDANLFWREVADGPHTSPFYYAGSLDPDVYVSREYAPLETRIKSFTAYAENVPAALKQIKANLKTPMPKSYVQIGRRTIGGLANFYANDVPGIFAAVEDAESQQAFQAANEAAIRAVREFDAWLEQQQAYATDDFALGPEKFSLMLKMTEGVDIPLGRLEEIGKRDLERNLLALQEACEKYAPGKSVEECMAQIDADKVEGNDPVAAATRQLGGLRKFVLENDIVTIPGTETAKVAQAPSYKAWNFAYINIPGAYESGLPSIYYVSPPDPSWPKEVQQAYIPSEASLLFTSVHEIYPGHFLQYLHAHRSASKIGRLYVGYAFSEGWAHYTEEMMYEAGLGGDEARIHIGQLQEALLRNVRFLSAIGLHTHGMTIEESKRMFREKAFQDEGNATQQALRGTFDPGYLNYTLGKLMIRKLRADWTATRGGRAAWKAFHDEFLSYGGPPVPLIRRAMMGDDDKGALL